MENLTTRLEALGVGESVTVQFEDRPIRIDRDTFGFSVHAVERGYFPVSSTGYRSFLGQHELIEEQFPELSRKYAAERKASVVAAEKLLAAKHNSLAVGNHQQLSRFLEARYAAERVFEQHIFGPSGERERAWIVGFQLLHRVVSDPMLAPMKTAEPGERLGWTQESCDESLAQCALHLFMLERVFAGDWDIREEGHFPYNFKKFSALQGAAPARMDVPFVALNYPTGAPQLEVAGQIEQLDLFAC